MLDDTTILLIVLSITTMVGTAGYVLYSEFREWRARRRANRVLRAALRSGDLRPSIIINRSLRVRRRDTW